MDDEAYLEYLEASGGRKMASTKARGLYPWFVWGGVGVNMKTPLFFLVAERTQEE